MLNFKQFLLQEKAIDFNIKQSDSEVDHFIDKLHNFKYTNELGNGVEAVAFFQENTQTVIKVIKFKEGMTEEKVRKESSYRYLQEIVKEFNSGNPYFPKVYSVRFYNSLGDYFDEDEGDMVYNADNIYGIIKMERLHSIDDIGSESETLKAAFRNAGFDYSDSFDVVNTNSGEVLSTERFWLVQALNVIAGFFKSGKKSFIKKIHEKNPTFAKAMIIIRNLIKKYRFKPDLHEGNIMVRFTSKGPQLVFTDPLIPNWWFDQ